LSSLPKESFALQHCGLYSDTSPAFLRERSGGTRVAIFRNPRAARVRVQNTPVRQSLSAPSPSRHGACKKKASAAPLALSHKRMGEENKQRARRSSYGKLRGGGELKEGSQFYRRVLRLPSW